MNHISIQIFILFVLFSRHNEKVKQMNSCMKLKFETLDVIYSTLFSPLLVFNNEQKEDRLKKTSQSTRS